MPSADFEPVIGLEVHAQLLTRTKNLLRLLHAVRGAAEHPGLHGVPGATGRTPGAEQGRGGDGHQGRQGLRLRIAERSIWARKNYFYPDLPKGYQISQYELPICSGGAVPSRPGQDRARAHPSRGGRGQERPHRETGARST